MHFSNVSIYTDAYNELKLFLLILTTNSFFQSRKLFNPFVFSEKSKLHGFYYNSYPNSYVGEACSLDSNGFVHGALER